CEAYASSENECLSILGQPSKHEIERLLRLTVLRRASSRIRSGDQSPCGDFLGKPFDRGFVARELEGGLRVFDRFGEGLGSGLSRAPWCHALEGQAGAEHPYVGIVAFHLQREFD